MPRLIGQFEFVLNRLVAFLSYWTLSMDAVKIKKICMKGYITALPGFERSYLASRAQIITIELRVRKYVKYFSTDPRAFFVSL